MGCFCVGADDAQIDKPPLGIHGYGGPGEFFFILLTVEAYHEVAHATSAIDFETKRPNEETTKQPNNQTKKRIP